MSTRDQAYQKIIDRAGVLFNKTPDELNEGTRFIEDLGAKSGNVSQMTTYLEDEFDVEISFMEFKRRPTLGEAADYIAELCDE